MEKLKIVHVVDYLMPTMGYQEFLLPKWNKKHGHDVHIITSNRYYPVQNYDDTWGSFLGPRIFEPKVERVCDVIIHRIDCLWEWKNRPWLKDLKNEVLKINPDVIFCHGSASPSSFRLASYFSIKHIPLIMDNHMHFVSQNRSTLGKCYYAILRVLTKYFLINRVYRFLGVAKECCKFIEREQKVPISKIESLPFGVDTDLFGNDKSHRLDVKKTYRLPIDSKIVLQTGKLNPDKGALWLAEAMSQIMINNRNVWLVFVGAGSQEYIQRIKHELGSVGVEDRLLIIPFVHAGDLAKIFQIADVCVFPAASSLSCLEAAACECPVIMTDLPAGKWRAELGVGLNYKTGDILDLRRKINALLNDPEYNEIIRKKGHDAIIKHFSYDMIAARAENLMYRAIAE